MTAHHARDPVEYMLGLAYSIDLRRKLYAR